MSLDNLQKAYIKKNLRRLPVSKIASDLGISESDIMDYLKKKWSAEKFERFARNRFKEESDSGQTASFSFIQFFRENRLVLAFLILLAIVSYANSFGNGFVSDDINGFLKNDNIGNFSSIFSGPTHFSLGSFFQFFAFHIGGMHPFTFRAINIFFHIGCVVLIYLLLSLSMNKRIAVIAAALFAVHPILIESVSWISGGPYSMYAFFFLFSFLFYLFSSSDRKYLRYSILFFVLAILASEKALALFLVFALYELAFGSLRRNWKKVIPYFTISFFLLILYVAKIGSRTSAVASVSYQSTGGGLYNPLIQIPVAVGSYLKLIFWPAKLTLYQTEMSFSEGQFLILLLIFLTYLGAIIWSWRKNKDIFFWLVFFIITLLPTLTPFKISWIVAERYVYLGTLGIIIMVAILFDKFLKLNENAKMVGYFLLTVIIASLSVRTIIRNRDWRSEDTLWIATAQVASSGQQIHNNLGDVYARQGDMQKAVDEFKKAIGINPNYADAYHNLGNTYQQMGQNDLAIENYQKAVSINPQLWQSYQNMAAIYFNQGQYDLALENIKKALEVNPNDENLKQNVQVIEAKAQGNQ
jgi:protein O-mannosyl-transferase